MVWFAVMSRVSQDPNVTWDSRQGATDVYLAHLLDQGKTLYLVSSALDAWSNPLGAWASFLSAPLFAASPDAAERLLLKTLETDNHCGFPLPFDLESEFSSDAACHLDAAKCALVDEWMLGQGQQQLQ